MSNRALAILGFVAFLVVFIYEMETLKNETERHVDELRVSLAPRGNRVDAAQTALALMVANELSYLGEVASSVVGKLHPDLKADIRYTAFKHSIKTRRSTRGVLTFEPLKQSFKEDYEALRQRYETETGEKVGDL